MNIFVGQMFAVHLQKTLTFAVLIYCYSILENYIGIISRITLLARAQA